MAENKVTKEKKPFYKRWWFIAIVVFVVLGVLGNALDDDTVEVVDEPAEETEVAEESKAQETETVEEDEVVEEVEETEPAIDIQAAELIDAYDTNEVKADKDYKGKEVNVTGIVENISVVLDQTSVTLGSGKDMEFISVQCFFDDEAEIDRVAELTKGDTITINGVVDGQSLNVSVKDCKLVE